jgi:Rieske Fe-S protein
MSTEVITPEQSSDIQRATDVSRRWFLLGLGAIFNGAVGSMFLVPIVRYLLSPVKSDSAYKSWVSLGKVTDYPVGETRLANFVNPFRREWDGETAGVACYVRRTAADEFQVFAVNCAHLGCPVRWFPQSQLFMCPCHGGAYYSDGSRASGPPERGLFTYDYRIVGGQLHINAGQMPTLSNTANSGTTGGCMGNTSSDVAKLVTIDGCKGNTPCGS